MRLRSVATEYEYDAYTYDNHHCGPAVTVLSDTDILLPPVAGVAVVRVAVGASAADALERCVGRPVFSCVCGVTPVITAWG